MADMVNLALLLSAIGWLAAIRLWRKARRQGDVTFV